MARMCPKCGGTGLTVDEKYCKCVDGKLKKATDSTKARALELKALEDVQKAAKEVKAKPPKDAGALVKTERGAGPMFKEGDWVENRGVIGIVWAVDREQVKFIAYYDKDTKQKIIGNVWVATKVLKPAPVEVFDNANDIFVNMALDTNDKDWFRELTGGKGNE